MGNVYALTTFDNPFDPFEDFSSWFLFDVEKGYNTCAYLGRIVKLSDSNSEVENNIELERAIDEIIKYDFRNIYKKVKKQTKEEKETKEATNMKEKLSTKQQESEQKQHMAS